MRFVSSRRSSFVVGLVGAIALAAGGCARVHIDMSGTGGDGAGGSSGGASAGTSGRGGAAGGTGGSIAGIGGDIGGSGGGGTGGGGATAGSAGGSGGSAGGRGGSGGTGGSAGTAGNAGRGGSGATGGTGGSGGTGAAGNAGRGGTGGSAGSGGGGTGGTPTDGGDGPTSMGMMPWLAGQIVITELMHNSTTISDDLGEWFEVYNPSTTITFDLLGCQVTDSSAPGPTAPVIDKNLVLAPGTFKTLAVSATPGFTPNFVYTPPGMEAAPPVKFDNSGGDGAQIFCGGVMIDAFLYPTSLAGAQGQSFSVDPAHYNAIDNDSTANWCLARNTMPGDAYETTGPNYGTPGRANTPCQ